MNLFDRLVQQALQARPGLSALQAVVEKELLHHDILREMSEAGLLSNLTFIGGTCLRACYGSERLSEDLDFTGGEDFTRDRMADLGPVLESRIGERYGLPVSVSEPRRERVGNVDTWKFSLITRPEGRHLPAQRIHVDVCALPSFDRRPMMLRNLQGVDLGTSGLILQAESREEILADKVIALALRPNRVKHRDLWDIAWLKREGVTLPIEILPRKIQAHGSPADTFLATLATRVSELRKGERIRDDFVGEMRRFLPPNLARQTIEAPPFWDYLIDTVSAECASVLQALG